MKTVNVGFRCSEKMKDNISDLAKQQGLSVSIFIRNTMQGVVEGKVINRVLAQHEMIQLIKETQELKTNHPDWELSGIEKVGEKLCQILL